MVYAQTSENVNSVPPVEDVLTRPEGKEGAAIQKYEDPGDFRDLGEIHVRDLIDVGDQGASKPGFLQKALQKASDIFYGFLDIFGLGPTVKLDLILVKEIADDVEKIAAEKIKADILTALGDEDAADKALDDIKYLAKKLESTIQSADPKQQKGLAKSGLMKRVENLMEAVETGNFPAIGKASQLVVKASDNLIKKQTKAYADDPEAQRSLVDTKVNPVEQIPTTENVKLDFANFSDLSERLGHVWVISPFPDQRAQFGIFAMGTVGRNGQEFKGAVSDETVDPRQARLIKPSISSELEDLFAEGGNISLGITGAVFVDIASLSAGFVVLPAITAKPMICGGPGGDVGTVTYVSVDSEPLAPAIACEAKLGWLQSYFQDLAESNCKGRTKSIYDSETGVVSTSKCHLVGGVTPEADLNPDDPEYGAWPPNPDIGAPPAQERYCRYTLKFNCDP